MPGLWTGSEHPVGRWSEAGRVFGEAVGRLCALGMPKFTCVDLFLHGRQRGVIHGPRGVKGVNLVGHGGGGLIVVVVLGGGG